MYNWFEEVKVENKNYIRTKYLLNESELIDQDILLRIEKNIIRLQEQIKGVKKYEGEDILTTLSIVKSHINKSEAITTAQIEGLDVNENEFVIELAKRVKLDFDKDPKFDFLYEPLNTIRVLKRFDKVIEKYSLSSRSIKLMHTDLFRNISSSSIKSEVGQFKRSTNILKDNISGEVIFIPAEVNILNEEMGAFEEFINKKEKSLKQIVINSGIMHAWFERIHPFSDGNGRVGRTLIPFYLKEQGLIDSTIINLSYEFRKHQNEYYRNLNSIQLTGSYREWLDFYLRIFLVTIKKINTFIDKIFEFVKSIEKQLSEIDNSFINKNRRILAKILVKNKIITINIFKKEIEKSFEKGIIVKVPTDIKINEYLKMISKKLGMSEISKKPLMYSFNAIPQIIV